MFKSKKSQIAVTDLFIALFMATIIIIIIMFAWNRYTIILNEESDYRELEIIAFQTADLLVKSNGEPQNWENSPLNVEVIGLATEDRNLSLEKVDAFVNLSYNFTLRSLGLELYDFYFQLKDFNGTRLAEQGKTPENFVVNIQRLVLYENEKAIVEFALWK